MIVQDTAPAAPELPHRAGLVRSVAACSPFMVVGKVNGCDEAARAATPAHVLDWMTGWAERDEEARAVWYLREDWPCPVTLIGRPAAGTIGESRRSAHLFTFEPGVVHSSVMSALCATRLSIQDIEWLNLGAGMPCVCCLALTKNWDGPQPRLPIAS